LKATGLPVELDQFYFEDHPGGPDEGWRKWCEDRAEKSACVLIVCSKGWFDSYRKEGPPGQGLGAALEAAIFSGEIYDAKERNARVRLVNLDNFSETGIPQRLKDWHIFRLFSGVAEFDQMAKWIRQRIAMPGSLVVATQGATLQVYPARDRAGNILLFYWLDGGRLQDTTVGADQIEAILASLARDFPRIQHRFGKDAIASVQHIAQSFSHYLFPPGIRQLLLAKRIHRLRVMVDETSPVLPWELAHDGDDFLGLKLFLVYSPNDGEGSVSTSETVRSILVVEGLADVPGIDLAGFLSRYLTRIDPGRASVNRVRASSLEDIRKAMQRHNPDVVHYVGHTISGAEIRFELGDTSHTFEQFCGTLGTFSATKLVVLDACETARCFPSYNTNPSYLLSVAGLNVVGTVAWLEMTTSEQFSIYLYNELGKGRPLEAALLESKKKLDRDGKEWWVFSHFGPGSPEDRALVSTAQQKNTD
jgi:hypothetical protein